MKRIRERICENTYLDGAQAASYSVIAALNTVAEGPDYWQDPICERTSFSVCCVWIGVFERRKCVSLTRSHLCRQASHAKEDGSATKRITQSSGRRSCGGLLLEGFCFRERVLSRAGQRVPVPGHQSRKRSGKQECARETSFARHHSAGEGEGR